KSLSDDLFNTGSILLVARAGEKVLGYIGMRFVLDECYITNIAVTLRHRREGIGKKLVIQACKEAKGREAVFITLEVRPSNEAALRLYEECGFLKEGMRTNFYTSPDEDGIIMTKRFN
ncbi:MAG: ribosomal protein S18-alanine N-acetyltransferase, partial [Oscillospiraceae bacterium]|nr:ribosomal protein S18-alanine N-acetyltransferase [Oscillospiraceae bacterium]